MSAALIWTFSPTSKTSNCFGFEESIREGNQISFGRNLIFQGSTRAIHCFSTSNYSFSEKKGRLHVVSLKVASPEGENANPSKQKVQDVVMMQVALVEKRLKARNDNSVTPEIVPPLTASLLREAYDRCSKISAEHSKTFYLGTLLMTPERRRALLAISVWCRRTDELVDGPIASQITPEALSRWELRLEDIFQGHPYDMLDAVLSDTVRRFPLHIQPFRDMVEGMRMDLWKCRYKNFDELYMYCYYVAGTVALMSVPVFGISPNSKATLESVYKDALSLGIANQLTNILRDVGEDARRGRVYLPQDELVQAGLSDEDIYAGKVTDKWRNFMRNQIRRARKFYDDASKGVAELDSVSRWAVLASLMLYRQILDEIEANDYDTFTRRACVSMPKKLLTLPFAYAKSVLSP